MRIKKVWAVYFSGTGTTEKTVRRIAAGMAQALDAELAAYDFTTPAARQRELRFGAEELVDEFSEKVTAAFSGASVVCDEPIV